MDVLRGESGEGDVLDEQEVDDAPGVEAGGPEPDCDFGWFGEHGCGSVVVVQLY